MKKLSLNKETLKSLSAQRADEIQAGVRPPQTLINSDCKGSCADGGCSAWTCQYGAGNACDKTAGIRTFCLC